MSSRIVQPEWLVSVLSPASKAELSADEVAHDFAGAAVEALEAGVAPEPGDFVFVDVAVAAVQLQAAIDDGLLGFGREQFGACGVFGGERVVVGGGDAAKISRFMFMTP